MPNFEFIFSIQKKGLFLYSKYAANKSLSIIYEKYFHKNKKDIKNMQLKIKLELRSAGKGSEDVLKGVTTIWEERRMCSNVEAKTSVDYDSHSR